MLPKIQFHEKKLLWYIKFHKFFTWTFLFFWPATYALLPFLCWTMNWITRLKNSNLMEIKKGGKRTTTNSQSQIFFECGVVELESHKMSFLYSLSRKYQNLICSLLFNYKTYRYIFVLDISETSYLISI